MGDNDADGLAGDTGGAEMPAGSPRQPIGNGARPGGASAGDVPRASDAALLRQIAQLERENRRLRERCEEAELENAYLERSLKNVENTLSFRLGYALIHSTKSLDGLRALPSILIELRRESRRRKRGDSEGSVILAALRSSVSSAGRLARSREKEDPPKNGSDPEL